MKYVFTFLLFLTLLSRTIAQPVITRDDILSIGDEFFSNSPDVVVDPGPAGEDVTWNFSSVVPDAVTYNSTVVLASTTPFAADFPTANIAFVIDFDGFTVYQYHLVNNAVWQEVGNVVTGFFTTEYQNPRTRLQFPLTYNSQWEDDFSYIEEFDGAQIFITSEGTSNVTVDAYGTLILPHTTFDDVLRVQYIDMITDTSDLGQGLSEKNVYHDTTYIWLSPSYHAPLAIQDVSFQERTVYLTTPDTVIIDSETNQNSSFQYDPMSGNSALRDVQPGKFELSISPNPFIQNLTVTFNTERPDDMQFILQDMRGNLIYQENLNGQAGVNTVALTLPNVPSGAYLAILRSSDGADIQKMVKVGTK